MAEIFRSLIQNLRKKPEKETVFQNNQLDNLYSSYQIANDEEKEPIITNVLSLSALDLIHLTENVCQKFQHKEGVSEFFSHMIRRLTTNQEKELEKSQKDYLFFVRMSNIIPNDIKEKFPKPSSGKNNTFRQVARNATSTIILERLVTDSTVSQEVELMLINLKKVHRGEASLPQDTEFTQKLLREHADKKVRKAINKIHKRYPKWSESQTVKPQSKNEPEIKP